MTIIAVPGADEDAMRIAKLIHEKGGDFAEIIVTLDSHHKIHIAHGEFSEHLVLSRLENSIYMKEA